MTQRIVPALHVPEAQKLSGRFVTALPEQASCWRSL